MITIGRLRGPRVEVPTLLGITRTLPLPLQLIAPKTQFLRRASKLKSTKTTRWTKRAPVTTAAAAAAEATTTKPSAPVILWFKHDLRTDDHPGLHEALRRSDAVVPFFCFDPRHYYQLCHSKSSATSLSDAVLSLRTALRNLGSDLVISTGPWEEELPKLAQTLGATSVIAEEELESQWRLATATAAEKIFSIKGTSSSSDEDDAFLLWTSPLFSSYAEDNFKAWKAGRKAPAAPLDCPPSLPAIPAAAEPLLGQLPPSGELLRAALAARQATLDPALAVAAFSRHGNTLCPTATADALASDDGNASSDADAAAEIATALKGVASGSSSDEEAAKQSPTLRAIRAADDLIEGATERPCASDEIAAVENVLIAEGTGANWDAELAAELAAGEGKVMNALNAYLCHLETAADGGGAEWQWRLGQSIAKFDVPAAKDGCFPALFNRALALGVISRRRIYSEAVAIMHRGGTIEDPPAGLLGKLAWLVTSSGAACVLQQRRKKAVTAAAAAEAGDFHAGLARSREGVVVHRGATLQHLRWRGLLTEYLVARPPKSKELKGAPAVLLVHGFGAFGEHWRDNVAALAQQGFTVYAPTLPGYGRAEKPAMPYGQDLWRDFLADFVLEVVQRPVVAAGNSIGGFIATSLAADVPGAVAGLVLVNSAGPIIEGYSPPEVPPLSPSPPLFIVEGVSRALFAFLQGDVTRQLRRVYPVTPARADDWLGREIARASADPGALGVFRSVFYLPKPRAINWLVSQAFGGPTLVLQGAKDPLNDAVGRAKELDRLCGNARVVLLDAGHCPHDEVPEQVNAALGQFLNEVAAGAAAE